MRYTIRHIDHGWRIYDMVRGEPCFGYWFSDRIRALRECDKLNVAYQQHLTR